MNVSSPSSGAANQGIWQMLAARAAANTRTGSTRSAGEASFPAPSTSSTAATKTATPSPASTATSASSTTSTGSEATRSRTEGPPPPRAAFDMAGMSTTQFAGMNRGGMPPMAPPPAGADPMTEVDTDGNGAVSADEFGLTSASEDVMNLFNAIDSDGGGDLSTDEMDAFRQEMRTAMTEEAEGSESQGTDMRDMPPMGPPPGPPPMAFGGGNAWGGSDADTTESTVSTTDTTTAGSAQPRDLDVQSFVHQLAARYASMASLNSGAAASGSLVSASA